MPVPTGLPGAFPYPFLGTAYACKQGGNGTELNI